MAETPSRPAAALRSDSIRRGDGFFLTIPPSAHEWAGFRAWTRSDQVSEHFRLSYIGGSIFVDASPFGLNSHVAVRGAISAAIVRHLNGRDLGLWVCGRVPVSHEGAALSTVPDGYFVSHASLRSGRARLVPTADGLDADEIEGSVDLVCEIVSRSSETRDTKFLRTAYYAAGVDEYWLVDARGDEIRFDILRRSATGYEPVPEVDGWQPSRVFAARVRLMREFGPVGLWQYRLDLAPDEGAAP